MQSRGLVPATVMLSVLGLATPSCTDVLGDFSVGETVDGGAGDDATVQPGDATGTPDDAMTQLGDTTAPPGDASRPPADASQAGDAASPDDAAAQPDEASGQPGDAGIDADGSSGEEAGTEAGVLEAGCSPEPPATTCGNACSTTATNRCGQTVQCGGCSPATTMTCTNHACTCNVGLTQCGGTCIDTTSDGNHCGSCTKACPASATCTDSQCVVRIGVYPPPTCVTNSSGWTPDELHGFSVTIQGGTTVTKLGVNMTAGGPSVQMGLYGDFNGMPDVLVASTAGPPGTALVPGTNEIALTSPVPIATTGTYWIMADYSTLAYPCMGAGVTTDSFVFASHSSPLPTPISGAMAFSSASPTAYWVVGHQ